MSNPREKLGERTKKLEDKSLYVGAVHEVNKVLLENNIPLGPNLDKAIHTSLDHIEQGTGESQSTQHLREVTGLVKDSIESLKHGEYKNAAVDGGGAFVNLFGIFAAGARDAIEIKREALCGHRHGNDNTRGNKP